MLIRAATIEDAPVLWRAQVETAALPGRLVSRPHELSVAAFERKISELSAKGSYIVAQSGDDLSGHALLEPMTLIAVSHVYRLTIVVHPGKTGRGVGTALLNHIQQWAASNSELHKIELLVRSTNVRAIQLYRRFAFVEEGILRDRVRLPEGTFVDDVAMAWFPARETR